MSAYYLKFNGYSSLTDYGCYVEAPAPLVRATERVTHVTIPGRPGDLTVIEGEGSYEPYIQSQHIFVPQARVHDVLVWLQGSGYVTFCNQADREQQARVINTVNLTPCVNHRGWYEGDVEFYCQPYKKRLTEASTQITSGQSLTNNGDIAERPVYVLTRDSGHNTMTISAGGKTLTLTGIYGNGAMIYADSQNVTDWTGGNYNDKVSGEFPVLPVGSTAITFTGCSSVSVRRRERFI